MPDIICRRQRSKNLLVVACGRRERGAGNEANNGKLVNNYTNRIMKLKPEEEMEVEVAGKMVGATERYERRSMSYTISIACGQAVASARFASYRNWKID